MRGTWILPLALLACGDSDNSDDDDTDLVVPDETADTFDPGPDTDDTDEPVDPNDTGVLYVIQVRGEAEVARGAKFEGWQALTAHWLAGGTTPGRAKCMYVQDLLNWERVVPSPGVNPYAQPGPGGLSTLDRCPDCTFAFTVAYSNTRIETRYPSTVDSDTDDTDLPPPDVAGSKAEGRRLNCTTLIQEQGFLTPEEIQERQAFSGVGFSPAVDGDNDDSTGWVYLWVDQAGSWSEYARTANFDALTGKFTWNSQFPYYEYAYP